MNYALKNRNNLQKREEVHASQDKRHKILFRSREGMRKYTQRPSGRSICVTVSSTETGSCQGRQGLPQGLKSQARRPRQ